MPKNRFSFGQPNGPESFFKKREDCTDSEWEEHMAIRKRGGINVSKKKQRVAAFNKTIQQKGMQGLLKEAFLEAIADDSDFLQEAVRTQMAHAKDKSKARESTAAFNAITATVGLQAAKEVDIKQEPMNRAEALKILTEAKAQGIILPDNIIEGVVEDVTDTDD